MNSFKSLEVDRALKWDRRFLELAVHISGWSKDPSTQVGCVIVSPQLVVCSTGYNGFPRGIADDGRLHDREQKYPLVVHAEENALLNAGLLGTPIRGSSAYTTWPPCTRCARMMIQVGIREVVTPLKEIPDRWKQDFDTAQGYLAEAGVGFRIVDLLKV